MNTELIKKLVKENANQVIEYRRTIHRRPELAGSEKETAAFVAKTLAGFGIEDIRTNIGGYGVVALIHGKGEGKCVGLRADMDALPIEEATGLPFSSEVPGISHMCGHDCHTAMLLGAAKVLNELRDTFPGTVKLVFQPAEEEPKKSGGRGMVAAGVLEDPKVDFMFAQHMDPDYETGTIGVKEGALSAASDRFYIHLKGKGCHGGFPQDGIDAVLMGAETVVALQSIVARQVSPMENAVVTTGIFQSGTKSNVVAETAYLEGTCRTVDPAVRDLLEERIEKTVRGVAEMNGGTYSYEYFRGYPSVINTQSAVEYLTEACSALKVPVITLKRPRMGGEDFAYFAEKVPSAMYRLGCTDPQKGGEIFKAHNAHFAPDESSLLFGTLILTQTAITVLEQHTAANA